MQRSGGLRGRVVDVAVAADDVARTELGSASLGSLLDPRPQMAYSETRTRRPGRVGTLGAPAMLVAALLVAALLVAAWLVLSPTVAGASAASAVSVTNLEVDAMSAPLGITDTTPTFTWSLSSGSANDTQTSYEVQAAGSASALASGTNLLWDSGVVTSSAQQAVYAGQTLGSRAHVYWRVQVTDSAGTTSSWTGDSFELGLLKNSDWTGQWITDSHWTGPTAGVGSTSAGPVTVNFAPVTARYIRLNVTQLGLPPAAAGNPTYYLQLAEMQVFGPGSDRDLALGAAVTSNDDLEGSGWGASRLTDGADDTQNPDARGFSSNGSSTPDLAGNPDWITIDLGSVQTVSSVALWPRTDTLSTTGTTASFPVDYNLQASSDDATFSTLTTATGTPAAPSPNQPDTITFAPTKTRYLKLNVTQLGLRPASTNGDSNYYAQLAEIQAFGPNSSTNLAAGASVTTNSDINGFGWSAQNLTDGVTNTNTASARGWSSTGSSTADITSSPVWVTIDLGSVQTVSSVSLWPRSDATTSTGQTASFPTDYTLQASTDNATFTTLASADAASAPPVPTPPVTVTFPTTQTRYVRLNITQLGLPTTGASNYYAQLAEVGVYSPDTPGDLAANDSVTSNNDLGGYGWSASYLTDGVTNSDNPNAHGWSTNASSSADIASSPDWVTIDLGSVQSVNAIRLWPRTDATAASNQVPSFPVDYSIQTSTDGSTFSTASTVTNQAGPSPTVESPASLPLLAKQFTTTGTVASARLFVTGEGIVVPSINGQKVGSAVLQPGDSDTATRLGYSEYDVTSMLNSSGANAIGLALGLGDRYIQPSSPAQGNRYVKYSQTSSNGLPRAIAQLEITYSDGSTQTIATDGSWKSALGPTTVTSWYGGEAYDANLEIPGWNQPGTDLSSWPAAVPTTAPYTTTQLVGISDPPLQVVQQNSGTDLGSPVAGSELYDFGTNAAGWEQFTISAPKGTTLTFTPGEVLSNGQVEQSDNDIGTPVFDTFTSNGSTETWHPSFDYHGFRYIEVSGITSGVTISSPTQLVIRSAVSSAGTFTTSDPTINAIHSLVDRSVQNNLYSTLTDCPSREKLGWDEEWHLLFDMISRNDNVDAYGRTLVQDLADAQLSNGLVPDVAPEAVQFSGPFRDDVNWGSAMIMVPWEMYQDYGDTQTLTRYYTNMSAYLSYLSSQASGGLVNYSNGLGDWGESSVTSVSTPTNLVENWGYYQDEQAMSQIATVLGKTSDAQTYAAQAAATLQAFTNTWFNASSVTVANGTEAAMAMALDIGAVPSAYTSQVAAKLAAAVAANGFAVGEIGLSPLFRVMSEYGYDSTLYSAVTSTSVGGYGYFVNQGMTALPEYWNITSGSHSHYMLGAVDLWMHNDLIGINQAPNSVGFQHLLIRPAVVGGMTSASGTLQTPYGQVAVSWSSGSNGVTLNATVPVGATATVDVPVTGSATPTTPSGATYVGSSGGYAQYSVGSGSWQFAPPSS